MRRRGVRRRRRAVGRKWQPRFHHRGPVADGAYPDLDRHPYRSADHASQQSSSPRVVDCSEPVRLVGVQCDRRLRGDQRGSSDIVSIGTLAGAARP